MYDYVFYYILHITYSTAGMSTKGLEFPRYDLTKWNWLMI